MIIRYRTPAKPWWDGALSVRMSGNGAAYDRTPSGGYLARGRDLDAQPAASLDQMFRNAYGSEHKVRILKTPHCTSGARHWFTEYGLVGYRTTRCVRCGAPNPKWRAA